MTSIQGHFDGNAVVLDEPASLTVGQIVRILVEPSATGDTDTSRPSLLGIAKGTFEIRDDFNELLDEFKDYRR